MKRITLILLILLMLISPTYAYNLTKIVGNGVLTTNVNAGEEVTVRYNDMHGFKFKRWISEGTKLVNEKSKTQKIIMPEEDVTLEVELEIQEYTITYNLDGGTATNPTTYDITSDITLNKPIREDYIFIGWTGTQTLVPTKEVRIKPGSYGDRTYTAHWEEIPDVEYKVYHYLENAEDTGYTLHTTEVLKKKPNKTVVLKDLAKTTGDFAHAAYEKGSITPNGSAVTTTTTLEDGSREIYLYYKRNTYKLTLNKASYITSVSGGGTYKWGKSININATENVGSGYSFRWQSNNTSLIPNITSRSKTVTIPKGDVTLTAKMVCSGTGCTDGETIYPNANCENGITQAKAYWDDGCKSFIMHSDISKTSWVDQGITTGTHWCTDCSETGGVMHTLRCSNCGNTDIRLFYTCHSKWLSLGFSESASAPGRVHYDYHKCTACKGKGCKNGSGSYYCYTHSTSTRNHCIHGKTSSHEPS